MHILRSATQSLSSAPHSLFTPSRLRLLAAFAAIYIIWGSTYLFILFAVKTLPPFLMAGTRWFIAGLVLYAWARLRGAPTPTRSQWKSAAVVGGLLLLFGNGGLVWAEQSVDSGLAALLIATIPLWMVLLDWLCFGGLRPDMRAGLWVVGGLVLGFAGIMMLLWPQKMSERVEPVGAAVLILAALSWAIGSLYSRRARLPESSLLTMAMVLLAGGSLLLAAGLAMGEGPRLRPDVSSLVSLGYLIIFGSLVAFPAYYWLLTVTSPARVSTHAFVNPVVAMLLGWAYAGEILTGQRVLSAVVILTAVAIIVTWSDNRAPVQHGAKIR